jgi:hypothetical protein
MVAYDWQRRALAAISVSAPWRRMWAIVCRHRGRTAGWLFAAVGARGGQHVDRVRSERHRFADGGIGGDVPADQEPTLVLDGREDAGMAEPAERRTATPVIRSVATMWRGMVACSIWEKGSS